MGSLELYCLQLKKSVSIHDLRYLLFLRHIHAYFSLSLSIIISFRSTSNPTFILLTGFIIGGILLTQINRHDPLFSLRSGIRRSSSLPGHEKADDVPTSIAFATAQSLIQLFSSNALPSIVMMEDCPYAPIDKKYFFK